MNWKQLYASATPQEREAMLLSMLRTIEARQNTKVIARGQIIRERRGSFRGAHFLNDRRSSSPKLRSSIWGRLGGGPRPVFLLSFMTILAIGSIGVWISFFELPPAYAAPLMLFHLVALSAILVIKPYRRNLQIQPQPSLS
jgi:hypothetical protein